MKKIVLFSAIIGYSLTANGQHAFETAVPTTFELPQGGALSISDQRCKDGKNSLLWEWSGTSVLRVNEPTVFTPANNNFNNRGGVTFWIYNEKSRTEPLTIRFVDSSTGELYYYFNFHLNYTGWKACWMSFMNMRNPNGGDAIRKTNVNLAMEIETPNDPESGRFFIDRYQVLNQLEAQTMPDAQIPENNKVYNKGGVPSHWGRLWEWESLVWDSPIPASVTPLELEGLKVISDRIAASHNGSITTWSTLKRSLDNFGIGKEGAVGVRPLVNKYDPQYNSATDLDLVWLTTTLYQLASLSYKSGNKEAGEYYVKVIKWAMDQGFDLGSCMGTNHHYGYDTRNLFLSAHWMRETLQEAGILAQVADVMSYWSALPECRQPYDTSRGMLTDAWNTLMVGRLCSALLYPTVEEQVRAVRSFYRWMSGSCSIITGTEGGIKPDFTGFHHGGHYPAYSVPGYSSVGEIIRLSLDTEFVFDETAKYNFKQALLAVSNYSNKLDWGIGICGRHPLGGGNRISAGAQLAFAQLAKAHAPIDPELAAAFLRINTGSSSQQIAMGREFEELGFTKDSPSGFFPFNYSCFGVFRQDDWMISLKGYNKWVWGAEIYTNDNRYGRYQSYGSAQIIIGSEVESRWEQNGWDWNRLPGTTSIHLPFERLDSPVNGTLMVKSPQTFSGATDLMGRYGLFVTRIEEDGRDRFTPSFVARKSIFCVDNRIVFFGSGISNQQSGGLTYPTETTLFQQKLNGNQESFQWKGSDVASFPFNNQGEVSDNVEILSDLIGNYYRIESGQKVVLLKQEQESRNDKSRAVTKGNFATAYIDHGSNPQDSSYEYMIQMQPNEEEQSNLHQKSYRVIQHDNVAHIVEDLKTGVVGYAIFENFNNEEAQYLVSSDLETLVMLQPQEGDKMALSICDPDINIGDNSYATTSPSQTKFKTVELKGSWNLVEQHPQISLSNLNGNSRLTAACIDGIPINVTLVNQVTSLDKANGSEFSYTLLDGTFTLFGPEAEVSIWSSSGVCVAKGRKGEENFSCTLPRGVFIVSIATGSRKNTIKIVN